MSHVPGRPSGNIILWDAWGRLLGLAWGPLETSWEFLGASWGITEILRRGPACRHGRRRLGSAAARLERAGVYA